MKPVVLQICRLPPAMEEDLRRDYDLHRLPDGAEGDSWLASHGADVRGVVTGGHLGIPNGLVDRLPKLEIVAINGVGFDKVDLPYAKSRRIRVTNTPGVLTEDVADLAIGLLIAALRGIPQSDRFVKEGRWPGGEIGLATKVSRCRIGIVGMGRIGRAIARRLEGFDAVIAYTDVARQDVPYAFHPDPVSLAADSRVLIIAASASAATRNLIGRPALEALGPQGALVNVARGSLVDEDALIAVLQEGKLGLAALDVFADEPNVPEALRALPNLVLTPHIASATVETRAAMAALVQDNLRAYFAGEEPPTALT